MKINDDECTKLAEGDIKLKIIKVVIQNGKRKIIVSNAFNGKDVRKEVADFILGNNE